ncbi:Ankyrin repeat domain-containing protein 17 [Hypsibius exemplaris]|uniref:Ankyrin repeat domain-containing protein 17 n=1 Tax=Hypsibius exemplaris TaxID=2072580 RepID=A0A1W0XB78_HYPEX|nr:Ankyrin repeat domain-containing protein 17 [Hypsibius exemplaris]
MGQCEFELSSFEEFFTRVGCLDVIDRLQQIEEPDANGKTVYSARMTEMRAFVLREFHHHPNGDGVFLSNLHRFLRTLHSLDLRTALWDDIFAFMASLDRFFLEQEHFQLLERKAKLESQVRAGAAPRKTASLTEGGLQRSIEVSLACSARSEATEDSSRCKEEEREDAESFYGSEMEEEDAGKVSGDAGQTSEETFRAPPAPPHAPRMTLVRDPWDPLDMGTKLGISPLMLASMNGHTTIVKLLIESNADVNQCIETNRNTALTLACFQGRTECVRVLVEKGANLEWRSKNGLNALMEAANGGFHEIGKILVDAGAEVDCAPVPSTKDTPLTIAAEKGHAKFCQLLIDNGAQVNLRNKKGCSPLWLACQNGHFDVVQALVGCGSADVDARDNRQMSCILTAFKRGHENIVRTLVDYIHCYPSEDEMTRYCREVKMNGNNSYLLSVYDRCKKAILDAKKKKEAEANQIANSLLEEVEMQQKIKESQKAKKREKKLKQKKKGKNDDDDSSVTGVSNTRTYDSEPPSPVASRSASEVRAAEAPGKNKPVAAVVEAPPEPAEDEEDEPEKGESSKKKKKRKNKVKGKAAADGADQVSAPITVAAPPAAAKSATVETPAATPKKPSTSSGPAVKKLEPVNAVTTPRPSTAPVQPTPPQPVDVDDNDENQWLSPSPPDVDEWIQQRSRSQKSSSTNAAAATTSHAQLPNQFELSSKNDPRRTLTNTLRQEGWKEVVGRSKRFKVPTSAIARIIGKAGTNINAIRASTCAHIEIEKNKPGINDRLITVRGTSEAVAEAYHIIKTLSDNPDRDLEELLRQTKLNSAEITRATVSQPSDVPVLIKPVPMPAEIESRRPRPSTQAPPAQAAATTHSTQVFTNSQMQQHRPQPPPPPPISTAAVVSTTAPENYSSVVAASSQQKRSSIHSSSSKESQEAVARVAADRDQQSANSPVSQRASPKGMASSSPGGAGDARNAQPVRSPAPASSPAMVKKTTVSGAIRPPPPSPQVLMKQQQQPQPVEEPKVVRLPTPTTCSSSQASSPSKPPSTVPPTTPGKSSTILGTLYQDLMMERNHWMPEPSLDLNFFTKDSLGPSSGPSDYQHQITPRESRLGSVFASGFDSSSLQSSSSSSNLTPQFGGFSANRPASLPQDLRASRQSDTSDYGVGGPIHNGFISPGYPTVNNNNSGMDPYSGGGSAYPPGTYGALANGHASSSIKYHPHGDSDEWLTNGGGVSGFSGSGGGGYSAFPKSDVDTERFMQLAANLAANLDQEQYFPLSGGGSQYGGNGRRGMMNGGSDFDSTSHDLGYNFDEPIPPVVSRGSRLMKPPTDSSGFGLGNGNYGGGNAPSSLGGYGWDSSLFGFGASGDPTALGTFGPISSAVPNAAGNRGTTRVNGSGGGLGGPSSKDAMKTSPQQQSSGDRRNY